MLNWDTNTKVIKYGRLAASRTILLDCEIFAKVLERSRGDTNMEEPSSICFTHFLLSSLIRIVRVSFRNFFAILYISLVSRNSITNPRSGEECEDRTDIGAKV